MNTKKDSYFIAFVSLLILNMLLIFIGVCSYFFSVKDYTIIAGIIAFFGAIIGGTITLVGVNRTIKDGRVRDKHKVYLENLGQRARMKYDVSIELQEMNNLLFKEIEEMPDEDITDNYFLDLLNFLNDRCRKLRRDGIHIGEDNFSTLKELNNAIVDLFKIYYDCDTDGLNEDETYCYLEYFEPLDTKNEVFDKLYKAIRICLDRSKVEEEKLFKKVLELSKN